MMLAEMTAPPKEALPVTELRAYLRLSHAFDMPNDAAEDAALAGFLRAAIAAIEARTGKVLLTRQFRLRLEEWRDASAQPLPLAPVHAIDRVEFEDAQGKHTPVMAADYQLIPDMQRPVLKPRAAWFAPIPHGGSVTITFSAGFGESWEKVPADLAQAALILAARFYEDRGFEGGQAAFPHRVTSLIERWRAVRVLGGRGNLRRRS